MYMDHFPNPFRPGAGHMPPYLAGRTSETSQFEKLLAQNLILENIVLTGLRGVGKTVLLETWKPIAQRAGWAWVGTDFSESLGVSEDRFATRILADLALVTSRARLAPKTTSSIGFIPETKVTERHINFETLQSIYTQTPGLPSDKLKACLALAWNACVHLKLAGIVFAYDEAQNLSDRADKDQYPLSLMLDVFQSLQRQGAKFMLALTGLPTLYPKLVESRTFAERMFRVISLDRLTQSESHEAIVRPIADCPIKPSDQTISRIISISGGYPYFIQFVCREIYDIWVSSPPSEIQDLLPEDEILRKLDADFFAGRWSRATDRQRELLAVIARLDSSEQEFTVQAITELSKTILIKPFSNSHINQMLNTLMDNGLIYKNRYGKYSFAVPLLNRFIRRQESEIHTLND